MRISALHLSAEQLAMLTAIFFALAFLVLPDALPKLGRVLFNIFKMSMLKSGKQKSSINIAGIDLSDEDRIRHTHIVGATGSGKTVLIEHLLFRDLARGCGAIIIDPKGERDFYERVKAYCCTIGREQDLKYLSATHEEESFRWNPCRLGNESELQSKFYGSSKYEHSFFAKACELALLQAFNEIGRSKNLTLMQLADALDRLSNNGKDENLKGLHFDIQNLATGEWAGILGTRSKDGQQSEISLLNITRKNEILFVDLPTEGKSVQSARLGALLLQEISVLSGMRKRNPNIKSDRPFAVYVDEFDAFATDPFISFLNKGRSSEFMIHLAHQTLSDLKKVSPTFEGQIMGNINVRFIFRMDLPEDAERLSRFLGTRVGIKHTNQTANGSHTGTGSAREVLEFEIHPDHIKKLETGHCIVGVKTSKTLRKVKIPMIGSGTVPKFNIPISRQPLGLGPDSDTQASPANPYAILTDLFFQKEETLK